jgi:site-specific recombinase XerD
MLAIAPHRDWTWLKQVVNRLDARARESKTRRPPPMLLDKSLTALTALETGGVEPDLRIAREYRDWLMVAMLSIMPLRLRNFANLSLERHLHLEGHDWRVDIAGMETKTGRPISMPIPAVVRGHIRHYLAQARPRLLARRTSDHFWISQRHRPLTPHAIYTELVAFTRRVFGFSIHPHLFRHIAATSTVVTSPEQLDTARALLTHATADTTEEYYILGRSVAASRKHAALVEQLRERLTASDAEDMVDVP